MLVYSYREKTVVSEEDQRNLGFSYHIPCSQLSVWEGVNLLGGRKTAKCKVPCQTHA